MALRLSIEKESELSCEKDKSDFSVPSDVLEETFFSFFLTMDSESDLPLKLKDLLFEVSREMSEEILSAKPKFFNVLFKDGRPYLFHIFRNKCFDKISLGNMLYFQNKL